MAEESTKSLQTYLRLDTMDDTCAITLFSNSSARKEQKHLLLSKTGIKHGLVICTKNVKRMNYINN